MRPVVLAPPFVEGMVTDVPAHALGPRHSSFAQDGYSPSGVFSQRKGWDFDGTTADVADNLVGIHRGQYVLADVTRTVTGDDDGELFIHEAAGAGTALHVGTVQYLPRCMYRDELIWCAQDGATPLVRYSGAGASTTSATASQWTSGQAVVTATTGTWGAGATSGYYINVRGDAPANSYPALYPRLLERVSSTVITAEGVKSTGTVVAIASVERVGFAYPCVAVYDAGTGSYDNAADTFIGSGTVWTGGGWGSVSTSDGLLVIGTTNYIYRIAAVSSASLLSLSSTSRTDTDLNYQILRRCPFKDAASHKGSLWGTGVAQFPSRVYVSPSGWNPAFPPGFTLPLAPNVQPESANSNDFLLDFIDVPASYDGDDNVAILPSPNALLVLKRGAVYGIYGAYPSFSVDMVADGIGCIDIRSAHSYDEGQFWAGESGIYWFSGGRVTDLTSGRINREWRALTRNFDYGVLDYCTLGVSQGHLIVHITTGGGTTQRTYLCDLRDRSWQSRVSNFTPRYLYTSRVPGEPEKLLAVSNAHQGRVIDFAPAINGSGTAKDDAGTGPRLQFHTTSGIAQANGIEGNANLVDLEVHANVYDTGAPGATVLALSTVHGGGTSNQADATKALTAINSDAADRIDRASRRIGRRGRLHQVRGEVTTLGTDSNATKIEVHQIVATVRDGRGRS